MKKFIGFTLLLVVCSLCQASNKWFTGIDINGNSSTFSDPQLFVNKGYGMNYMLNAERYFNKKLSFKTGLGLERKNFKIETYYFDTDGGHFEYETYRLSRVSLPILLSWHFGGKKQWYFDAGAALKLFPRVSSSDQAENSSATSGAAIAPQIGLGYEISAGNFKIDIGTHINYGLRKCILFEGFSSGYIRDIGLVIGVKYGW